MTGVGLNVLFRYSTTIHGLCNIYIQSVASREFITNILKCVLKDTVPLPGFYMATGYGSHQQDHFSSKSLSAGMLVNAKWNM